MVNRKGLEPRERRVSLGIVLGFAALLVTPFAFRSITRPLATPGEVLWSYLLPMDTEFAADFDERAFGRVRQGMTRAEVVALVGEPLDELRPSPGSGSPWVLARYTRSPSDGNTWQRSVTYGPEGRVRSVDASLWID